MRRRERKPFKKDGECLIRGLTPLLEGQQPGPVGGILFPMSFFAGNHGIQTQEGKPHPLRHSLPSIGRRVRVSHLPGGGAHIDLDFIANSPQSGVCLRSAPARILLPRSGPEDKTTRFRIRVEQVDLPLKGHRAGERFLRRDFDKVFGSAASANNLHSSTLGEAPEHLKSEHFILPST
jgi:hypothetical protein